jgi:hypothetical protein
MSAIRGVASSLPKVVGFLVLVVTDMVARSARPREYAVAGNSFFIPLIASIACFREVILHGTMQVCKQRQWV